MIEVGHLTKDFGRTRAVDDVSFRVEPGEIVGFLGPNGAGKTTTIRILTGFIPATTGAAAVAGFDVFRRSLEVRRRVGYLPENVPLYGDQRVEEFLRFRARLKQVPARERTARVESAIERAAVGDVRRKLVAALSRGYRQRVGLADALLADPPVLILDEPTSGLDPLQRIEVKNLVLRLKGEKTILFSSHILPEVESVCRRVLIIHRGRILADGTPDELVTKLGGRVRYRVEFAESPGPADAVRRALEGLPGVLSAASDPRADGAASYVLTAKEGADPRVAAFRLAAAKGWMLRELSREASSLEELFARIALEIGSDGAEGSAPAPGGEAGGAP
ncbi:MAG TPA: ATP-binding cassette domain-containing protein [Planctomycetota bacterium]|jgi:ABC-2 type transport system ATP-binding protein|nr:ATP-binding cassette domain-containing protein [Planctomycetota bacterium]